MKIAIECGQKLYRRSAWRYHPNAQNRLRFRRITNGFAWGPILVWRETPIDEANTWPGNHGTRVLHDPTGGRIDKDIQEWVERVCKPHTTGQRVVLENNLQMKRDSGKELAIDDED